MTHVSYGWVEHVKGIINVELVLFTPIRWSSSFAHWNLFRHYALYTYINKWIRKQYTNITFTSATALGGLLVFELVPLYFVKVTEKMKVWNLEKSIEWGWPVGFLLGLFPMKKMNEILWRKLGAPMCTLLCLLDMLLMSVLKLTTPTPKLTMKSLSRVLNEASIGALNISSCKYEFNTFTRTRSLFDVQTILYVRSNSFMQRWQLTKIILGPQVSRLPTGRARRRSGIIYEPATRHYIDLYPISMINKICSEIHWFSGRDLALNKECYARFALSLARLRVPLHKPLDRSIYLNCPTYPSSSKGKKPMIVVPPIPDYPASSALRLDTISRLDGQIRMGKSSKFGFCFSNLIIFQSFYLCK
ncbi:hypothetical protein Syun_025655 [Stephania yunnanensis]|uniref:Uncharacterized protein n=1 Tax=Stephania yunnanensis TaxID=152371 RepID=A0AAP0HWD2_9MAGN